MGDKTRFSKRARVRYLRELPWIENCCVLLPSPPSLGVGGKIGHATYRKEETMRPHLSPTVRDLQSSVEFYRKVFGVTPQKQTVDYAKFDLTTPPLNFSLVSSFPEDLALPGVTSVVNHLGIEVDDPGEVAAWER